MFVSAPEGFWTQTLFQRYGYLIPQLIGEKFNTFIINTKST